MRREIYIDECPGIPDSTMKDMRERFGYDEDDTSNDEEILHLSGKEFLEEYMSWHGIIGFSDMIIEAIYMAYGIDLENEPFDRDMEREIEKYEY